MKKSIIALLVAVMVSISSIGFVGCTKDPDTIRINEVTHSVFYAPLYLAMSLGYFEEEGIKIDLAAAEGSNTSMATLLSNNCDIALAGPETVVYVAAGQSTDIPVVFGQLTKRDGAFLVSKTPIENFNWSTHLRNKTVIAGRAGGLPAMTFEWVVNSLGMYRDNGITLDTETSFAMQVPTFEATDAEFCTMFEPTASEFVAAGKGHIVASIGEQSGEIPYTCFIAKKGYLSNNSEKIKGFLRAIKKAYTFIQTNEASVVAEKLQSSFPSSSLTSLEYAITSYKNIDAWMSTPAMTQSSYNRLIEVLKNAGTLDSNASIPFSTVVDNTYAHAVA